jgi:hypothetical protein
MAGNIDLNYTVEVDNSANSEVALRYACWFRDGSDPTVTETSDSVIYLNYDYTQSGDENDAYITKPLTLLSFAYKDADNVSSVGQKLCCPTNMIGFDTDDEGIIDLRWWSQGTPTAVLLDADEYVPFRYYVAFAETITGTSVLSGLMLYANEVLGDTLKINSLVLPKTVKSFDINDLHKEGGVDTVIQNLIFQMDDDTLKGLIEDPNSGFADFIEGIDGVSTNVYFTDTTAKQTFEDLVKEETIKFTVENLYYATDYIKTVAGEPPDITKLDPKK